MAEVGVNGVRLYYELHGDGDPLVLVHGSWVNASAWQLVVPALAESFRVLVYDRRGHSRSERPDSQGSVHEDAADLAALLAALDLAPAHVVTNSYGGNIALRLAAKRHELFRSLSCHEPPLFELLAGDADAQEIVAANTASIESVAGRIASGDHEGAARQFVEEVAFGPGAWENELPPPVRAIFVENAPTFLDELQDPDQLGIDLEGLGSFDRPLCFSDGSGSPPSFSRTLDRLMEALPSARRERIEGAAHVPQLTHPDRYVELLTGALRQAAAET
jgi:pimeloyl-ACP methyl ester carboxylesterase